MYIYIHTSIGACLNSQQDGARSTIILFDFLEKKVKIGGLDWSPLRVLEVETKFDGLELKVDKSFLESVRVPGKVKTNKQTNIFAILPANVVFSSI